jgi:hypothetical protein
MSVAAAVHPLHDSPATTRALTIDVTLAHRLRRGPRRARVHSVFHHVVNLSTRTGRLIALSARSLDDAPWSVRVDVADWAAPAVHAGEPAVLTASDIRLPGRRILIDGARRWRPRLPSLPLDTSVTRDRIRQLEHLLDAAGDPAADGRRRAGDAFAHASAARLRAARTAAVRAELAGDRGAATAAVVEMLGLGPGLTPAGDDMLVGMALVAACPNSGITVLPWAIVDALARHPHRTTDLSRTTLHEAVRGRARQSLIDLLEGACRPPSGTADDVHLRLEKVLGIGHTSGRDLASGILTGLRLASERRGSA